MLRPVAVLLLASVALTGAYVSRQQAAVQQFGDFEPLVAAVNSVPTTWTAEVPTRFGSIEEARVLMGTWLRGHPNFVDSNLPFADHVPGYVASDLPTDYDAVTAHSNCTVIANVRDQSSCGSCWAFGATEAFESSRCISTGKDIKFSPTDTGGCCSGFSCGFSMGCNGGQPSSALSWMTSTGVVTGGDFEDIGEGTGCKPYQFQPCAHHTNSTKYPPCPEKEYSLSCDKECSESKYDTKYRDDKQTGTDAFSLDTVEGMQTAIMRTGPLAVAFTVYSDFLTYSSGVYTHVSGEELGGHAVLMVGWGEENGVPYWKVKNSWNDTWGNGGFFKIKRGSDECGIESDVTGIKF